MAYTAQEALGQLALDPSKNIDDIIRLVKEVSGEVLGAPPGSTYLLYSGVMPDGTTSAGSVASAIKVNSGGTVYDLISSEVGTFVNDPQFRVALGGP